MEKNDLQDNLAWQLIAVSIQAKKGLLKIAEEHDLTFIQVYMLCTITPNNPMSMNTIAGMLHCDASNVTGIIDRLFSREYVTRQEKPGDRRVKMVSLTSKGEQLREKIVKKILAYRSESLEKLNIEDREKLSALLRKILE